MDKLRFGKHIICLLALAAVFAAAGCGGGEKKTTDTGTAAATASGSVVNGKVDLFSGFGVELDGAGRAALLHENAAVKLYRLQPDGGSVMPLPDVPAVRLEGDTFRIEKAPIGERNLIVRVEGADSKPILAAILPPIQAGENTVVVSPETDVEASLFQKIIQNGVRQAKDVKPWEFDAAYVKELVSDSLFYDMKAPKTSTAASDMLLPVARAAYGRFLDSLMNKIGVAANDKKVLKLLDSLAGPMMKMAADYESGGILDNEYSDFETALSRAARDAGLKSEQMSGEAVWTAARRQSLLWAARCIAGAPGTESCPKAPTDSNDFVPYGGLLEKSLAERWNSEDMIARKLEFADAAAATGAVSVSSLIAVKRLVALPEKSISVLTDALAKIDSEPDADRRVELEKRQLQDVRDSLLLGVVGMDPTASAELETTLDTSAKPLAVALYNTTVNVAAAGATHDNFISACNLAFQPLTALLNKRFPKLEKTDLGKLDWAIRTIVLNATLFDLPPVFYNSLDADGDGAPDNEERVVGTDPVSSKSTPAPVLVVTPASMLPAQPDDTDNDGYFDVVETAAGTRMNDANSTPQPGRMALCGKPSPVCLAPLPEAVAGAEVDGTANYLTLSAQGIYAGLYGMPSFTGREPMVLASAETARDGMFKIENVKPGRYFIAGFTDISGSGRPESGNAAGFAGGDYPRRITAASGNNKIDIPIDILGVLGKGKCPPEQYYNPAGNSGAGTCMLECPAGMEASKMLRSCHCENGYMSPLTSSCVEKCPDTMFADRSGTCVCPPGTQLEKSADGKSGSCTEIKREQAAEKPAAVPKDEKASKLISEPPLSPVTDRPIPGATGTMPVMSPNINLKTQ